MAEISPIPDRLLKSVPAFFVILSFTLGPSPAWALPSLKLRQAGLRQTGLEESPDELEKLGRAIQAPPPSTAAGLPQKGAPVNRPSKGGLETSGLEEGVLKPEVPGQWTAEQLKTLKEWVGQLVDIKLLEKPVREGGIKIPNGWVEDERGFYTRKTLLEVREDKVGQLPPSIVIVRPPKNALFYLRQVEEIRLASASASRRAEPKLEDGVLVLKAGERDEAETESLAGRALKPHEVAVLVPKELVGNLKAESLRLRLYHHPTIEKEAVEGLLPEGWTVLGPMFLLSTEDLSSANTLVRQATEAFAGGAGQMALFVLDSKFQAGIKLPKDHPPALLLNSETIDRILRGKEIIDTLLIQHGKLVGLLLDLTSGSTREREYLGKRYYVILGTQV